MVTKILSVGGSMIAPDKPDTEFLAAFVQMAKEWLAADKGRRLILVAGGGAPARVYQGAYKEVCSKTGDGFDNSTNPTADIDFKGQVLVASGWKPGFSSDNDAVLLAEKFGADTVVNLSNIEKVYTDDPRKNPDAKPLDEISWADFRKMVGDEWVPGKNVPFDPVASKKAAELGLTVICSAGKNIANTKNILDGAAYVGTTISK